MNTLDELLEVVPGLRKGRSLSADMLRLLLDRDKRQCTWCGEQVGKGRRRWCSDECVLEYQSRCQPSVQAKLVLERDRHVCQECGRNTQQSEDEWYEWRRSSPMGYMSDAAMRKREAMGYARNRWREVDHIVPVIDGGGLCRLDNLRVLCGACHARVTRELSKRRAKQGAKA